MVLFVTSDSPNINKTQQTDTKANTLNEWIHYLVPYRDFSTINVFDNLKEGSKKHKSEVDLLRLSTVCLHPNVKRIIAFGDIASEALETLGFKYFKLPSPDPSNKFLNNQVQVEAVLEECKKWLKGD